MELRLEGRRSSGDTIPNPASIQYCVPGIAHFAEVVSMLLEDGEPSLESEFVGTQTVQVG